MGLRSLRISWSLFKAINTKGQVLGAVCEEGLPDDTSLHDAHVDVGTDNIVLVLFSQQWPGNRPDHFLGVAPETLRQPRFRHIQHPHRTTNIEAAVSAMQAYADSLPGPGYDEWSGSLGHERDECDAAPDGPDDDF